MVNEAKWANVQHVKGLRAREPECAAPARSVRYEGYGPGESVVLVDCLTDDRERTRALLRRIFLRHGGHLGAGGSVSYLFDHVGLMRFASDTDLRRLAPVAFSAGAEDVVGAAGRAIEVLTDPQELEAVRSALARRGFVAQMAEVTERASLTASLGGAMARAMVELIGALADLQDVRNVYSNVEISDPVLAQL